jgi:hypothetical protein
MTFDEALNQLTEELGYVPSYYNVRYPYPGREDSVLFEFRNYDRLEVTVSSWTKQPSSPSPYVFVKNDWFPIKYGHGLYTTKEWLNWLYAK